MSPMVSNHETVVYFQRHRQQLHILTMNLGCIPGKQYWLAGQWEIQQWMTEPTKDGEWENPDIWFSASGVGDVFLIQEAWCFEEDGAIADRLRLHGFKVTYFRKGKAPPLAVLVRGPTAEQIRECIPAAEELSGQRPKLELALSVEIVASDTVP